MTDRIYTFGNDERLEFCKLYLEKQSNLGTAVYVLPIPSFRQEVGATGVAEALELMRRQLSAGDTILCYGSSEELRRLSLERGAYLIDAASDEEYHAEGARLTAVGSIARLITCYGKDLRHIRFGIVGYGRIGRALCMLLVFFGSQVTVYTRREELRFELGRLGINTVSVRELEESRGATGESPFASIDILINTAPAKTLAPEDAAALSGVSVIELASGDNIPKEIACQRYDAVPARMLPYSAGVAYAQAALRALKRLGRM